MKKLKVMSVFGTRPEAIKMAPLVQELARREHVESLLCVTAQHRQMLDSVLEIFHLQPDYDLDIMEPRQTLTTITSKALLGMEKVIEQAKPDLILVHGDTTTTFAGADVYKRQVLPSVRVCVVPCAEVRSTLVPAAVCSSSTVCTVLLWPQAVVMVKFCR